MDTGSRRQNRFGAGAWAVLLPALMLLACSSRSFALNPALDVSQYAHTAWRLGEGIARGRINAIAQTPDGYLWLGTDFGLIRFDGVTPTPWSPQSNQTLPSAWITSLLAARDGTLWVGTSKGLATLKDDKLTIYPGLAGQLVMRLLQDHEGTIWAGTVQSTTGRLCAIRDGVVRSYGEDGRLGPGIFGLYEDRRGNLWVGVLNGLWRWNPGAPKLYSLPGAPNGIQGFGEDDDGTLLIGWNGGIYRFLDGTTEKYPLSGEETKPLQAIRMLRDRDGSLWVGTFDEGLVHLHEGRTDRFSSTEGLSGEDVLALFEDREGVLWVATSGGLDRFRNLTIATFTGNQGLSSSQVWAVLASSIRRRKPSTREGMPFEHYARPRL